jgi:hypothetical protein
MGQDTCLRHQRCLWLLTAELLVSLSEGSLKIGNHAKLQQFWYGDVHAHIHVHLPVRQLDSGMSRRHFVEQE